MALDYKSLVKDIKRDELYFDNDNRCFEFVKLNYKNTDNLIITEKISAMNNGILETYYVPEMAQHIQDLNIDPLLQSKQLDLVSKIAALNEKKSQEFKLFASTYCCFHEPETYPMQSKIAEEIMQLYVKNSDEILSGDFNSYENFKHVTDSFIASCSLEKFNYYEVEKFLWLKSKILKESLTNS